MDKKQAKIFETNYWPLLLVMAAFAAACFFLTELRWLAITEGGITLVLALAYLIMSIRRRKAISNYMETFAYDVDTAKNSTLTNFPLPIVVFKLEDSKIIWGNEMFFDICGEKRVRGDATVTELVEGFTTDWLIEGKGQYPNLLDIDGRKYQIRGSIVRSDKGSKDQSLMCITYWLDVTDYDDIRREFEDSRPVAAIFAIDNYDELIKKQPERIRNDLRDAVGDKLSQWCEDKRGILFRVDRDRYVFVFEERYMDDIIAGKFDILESVHQVVSPSGIKASLSMGIGRDAEDLDEAMQYAQLGIEMALSRGGDQAVIKNKFNFEFYGGRTGGETESRTKVKSRVMANALLELIKSSSQVLVMGHRFADMDAIGGAVGVCCIARRNGVKCSIVCDSEKNHAKPLIESLKKNPEYKDVFISAHEAMIMADSRTLLVVVDTNRPEQVEDLGLLQSCNRVAVIDHHRRAATYIEHADLSYIEPYASSVCELLTEILEVALDEPDILRCEAEAMLSGIVLDTKSFTMRTGERTFDAAAFLKRGGADTVAVQRFMQSNIDQTVEKYKILQSARLYRSVAVAAPDKPQNRIVAAKAADELLNVAGVDASMVIYPNGNGVFVSARAIGEMNVQLIMEKLGGGGNRTAAAAQMEDISLRDAVNKLFAAIDEYLDN